MLELRIHGYGGQGAVTLAHLLATVALNNGHQGQALPSFGVERRGAPVKAVVRIADEQIRIHSQSVEPDILVLMDSNLLPVALAGGMKDGGDVKIICNGTAGLDCDYPCYMVDAAAIATEAGLLSPDGPFINVPMFGACCKVLDIPEDVVAATIRERWHGAAAEKNLKGALGAYHAVALTGGK